MSQGLASRWFTGRRRYLKRFALGASLAALSVAANVAPAAGAVTIGQLAPGATGLCTATDTDALQAVLTSGNSYVVPVTGTITSWSHNARAANGGQQLTMKIFRKVAVADPPTYQAVGHDGPRPLVSGTLNTFPTSIAVKSGDLLGLNLLSPNMTGCVFEGAPEDRVLGRAPGLADGESGIFPLEEAGRLNISAVVAPSNSFTVGKAKLNKKKGTATLSIDVPNPGELTGSGKGVKVASAAVTSKTFSAPGKVKLTIRAKGKKKKKLNQTGKVKVKPKITYTPTGGDPSTQSLKVKLKKKV
jgi:hypothetical protein